MEILSSKIYFLKILLDQVSKGRFKFLFAYGMNFRAVGISALVFSVELKLHMSMLWSSY